MSDYVDLQKAAAYAAQDTIKFADEDEEMRALQRFHEEVDPETVLALIAENERLKTLRSTTERDLAQELEVWRHGPSCWNCGDTGDVHDILGEWRGQCDCNAAKLIDVSSERDQLKAENKALKAKTETYCSYGDEGSEHTYYGDKAAIEALTALVFEVEGLRQDSGRYQWLRDKSEPVHQFYLSVPLWFTGVRFRAQDVDKAIDAMSKGEQL